MRLAMRMTTPKLILSYLLCCVVIDNAQSKLAAGCDFHCVAIGRHVRCLPASSTDTVAVPYLQSTDAFGKHTASIDDIQAGCMHVCVRQGASVVTCFGSNEQAQLLGHSNPAVNQHTADFKEPVELHVGSFYTCVMHTSSETRCWGFGIPDTLVERNTAIPAASTRTASGSITAARTTTVTASVTRMSTPSKSTTATHTAAATVSDTCTVTHTSTASPSASNTHSANVTRSPSSTQSSSTTPHITSTPSSTASASATASATETSSSSETSSNTITSTPTATTSPSPSSCRNGKTQALAARSMVELQSCGSSTDGFYWFMFGSTPKQVYCEPSKGGWMYVMPPHPAPAGYDNPFGFTVTPSATEASCVSIAYTPLGGWYHHSGYRCGGSTLYHTYQITNTFNATTMKLALILNGVYNSRVVQVNGQTLSPPSTTSSVNYFYGTYNHTCGVNTCWQADNGLILNTTTPFTVPVRGNVTMYVGGCCSGYTGYWGIGIGVWQLALR